jgi:hypothetical protein
MIVDIKLQVFERLVPKKLGICTINALKESEGKRGRNTSLMLFSWKF